MEVIPEDTAVEYDGLNAYEEESEDEETKEVEEIA
jgi:hypothetical protein